MAGIGPVTRCLIMEFRWAREREQLASFRENCIGSFHMLQGERELLASSITQEQETRVWGTEADRAILGSDKWREAAAANRGVKRTHDGSAPGTRSKVAPSTPLPASVLLESRRAHAAALSSAHWQFSFQIAENERKKKAENERQWAIGVLRADLAAPEDP
jgi:hypothetical protein